MFHLYRHNFDFVPLFLVFFKKFNYLPASVKFQRFNYTLSANFKYFIRTFLRKGSLHQIEALYQKTTLVLSQQAYPHPTGFNTTAAAIDLFQSHIGNFFSSFNYVFLFFFAKLNKKLLKYSNYKRKRYSINLLYIPPYRRAKALIKFAEKNLIYIGRRSFSERFTTLLRTLILNPADLFFLKYTIFIQSYILRKKLYTLFSRS